MTFPRKTIPCPPGKRDPNSKLGKLGSEILQMPIGDTCIEVQKDDYDCRYIHASARLYGCRVKARIQDGGFYLVWRVA